MIDPVKAVIGYSVSMIAIAITMLLGLWAMPYSFWFEYETVKPITPVKVGQELRFQSFRTLYRPTKLLGVDALFCDLGDGKGFHLYSHEPWESTQLTPPSPSPAERLDVDTIPVIVPKPWRYEGDVPMVPSSCYLKSSIGNNVGYGIIKYQRPSLVSENFNIE